ncbi:SPOR domain-containing protein [Dysgonomonas sp. 521]|uniref:SPOR domain-containing protein n=1 Tax=Dysgonomonas sp. 521 TaxID=2302932 RepID=UPI00210458E0|nr:SPOR domain-containing protein [Dysgonomonas sp. 521]
MKKENVLVHSDTKWSDGMPQGSDARGINYSAESAYMAQVKSKYEHYKVNYDDSEYANGDVYVEAAKRRQAMVDQANKNCPDCQKKASAAATTGSPASPTTQPASTAVSAFNTPQAQDATGGKKTPDFFAHLLDADRKLIRTEGVSYLNADDKAKLRRYNVIIAALSKYEGVERLQKAFRNKETLYVVRNDIGLYYVIIGSYDTEDQAAEKIRAIESQYTRQYTTAQLLKTYGIPLTDLWILRK